MTKVRVHELAKELDSNSKEIIGLMSGFDFPTRNHMSSLEQEELDVLFERLTQAYDGKVEIPVFAKIKEAPAAKPEKKKKDKVSLFKRIFNCSVFTQRTTANLLNINDLFYFVVKVKICSSNYSTCFRTC